jgi:hypothetical protein
MAFELGAQIALKMERACSKIKGIDQPSDGTFPAFGSGDVHGT